MSRPLPHPASALLALIAIAPVHAQISLVDLGYSVSHTVPNTDQRNDGRAVFVDALGRIVTVDETSVVDANPNVVGIGLARFVEFGGTDTEYNRVKNAALVSVDDAAISLLDETLVVGEFISPGNQRDSALVRFTENGNDDTSFAGDGGAVWDASGAGQADFPSAVADVGGGLYVGGSYDANAGAGTDFDVYLGKVDGTTGAFTRLRTANRGTFVDQFIDIEAMYDGVSTYRIVWLSDSAIPGYAGDVEVMLQPNNSVLGTIAIKDTFTAANGCDVLLRDAESVDLVPLSPTRAAVVGHLVNEVHQPVQPYVVVVDIAARSVVSTQCGPSFTPGQLRVKAAAAKPEFSGAPPLHLAVDWNGVIAYWGWGAKETAAPRYRPDPAYANAAPITLAMTGRAEGITVDDQGRALVTGHHNEPDHDVTVVRVRLPRIFRDAFGQ